MMKTSKLLININDLKVIEEYKKIGIVNFLFAVKNYSIGYNSFDLSEIPYESYLLINRVFDTDAIDSLKENIFELKKYRGILFEDIGVYYALKDEGINLIWFQNHFGTNINSINFWLSRVSSAVISNEITKSEIISIIENVQKPIVFNIFGKNQIMYSRRKLLSNFQKHFNLDTNNNIELMTLKNNFLMRESEYGTVIFNNEYFNYLSMIDEINDDNILFYYIANLDLDIKTIENIIGGNSLGNDGFLNKKTVYKMSEYNDR